MQHNNAQKVVCMANQSLHLTSLLPLPQLNSGSSPSTTPPLPPVHLWPLLQSINPSLAPILSSTPSHIDIPRFLAPSPTHAPHPLYPLHIILLTVFILSWFQAFVPGTATNTQSTVNHNRIKLPILHLRRSCRSLCFFLLIRHTTITTVTVTAIATTTMITMLTAAAIMDDEVLVATKRQE